MKTSQFECGIGVKNGFDISNVKYTITVTADKGTANERSVTDTLHVSLRGEYKPLVEEEKPEQETLGEMIEDDVYIMVEQAVLGDFSTESGVAGIAARIAIGFVPGIGQISDVRDVVAQCIYIDPQTGDVSIDVNVDGLKLSLIAFMPGEIYLSLVIKP